MCCNIRCPYCHRMFEHISDYREARDYLQLSDMQRADYLERVYKHKCEQRVNLAQGDEINAKNENH
jgi:uncharacterized Fe-S cluster-containing radical SAM superfamily protein